jgi:hypothetical protein
MHTVAAQRRELRDPDDKDSESWLVTMDDVRLHLCNYKQQTLTKGNGAKSEGGKVDKSGKDRANALLGGRGELGLWRR